MSSSKDDFNEGVSGKSRCPRAADVDIGLRNIFMLTLFRGSDIMSEVRESAAHLLYHHLILDTPPTALREFSKLTSDQIADLHYLEEAA